MVLVDVSPDPSDDEREVLEQELARRSVGAAGILHHRLGRHLPGPHVVGGYTWDLAVDGDNQTAIGHLSNLIGREGQRPGGVSLADGVLLDLVSAGSREPDIADCVKRTLLLRVDGGTSSELVERFEADLLAMPHYVPAIRNWSLSRAVPVAGDRGWTHVWEQEFRDLDGLRHDYMETPYHWGVVDQWFYPGGPTRIVDPGLAHVFCPSPRSVLTWSEEA